VDAILSHLAIHVEKLITIRLELMPFFGHSFEATCK
jgi:hypothetical protein